MLLILGRFIDAIFREERSDELRFSLNEHAFYLANLFKNSEKKIKNKKT